MKVVPDPDAVEALNAANGSSYTLLGEEYYQIVKDTGSITAEGRRATLTVRLDCKGIMALPYMNDYVLPLRLSATGTEVNEKLNTILINPRMQETEVLAENAGVVESDLSATDANTLEFTAYTEFNNKWDSRWNTNTAMQCSRPITPSTARNTSRCPKAPTPSREPT